MAFDQIPPGPFTRSRLVRFTGLTDEVVAHWTKEGLLRPMEQVEGSGRHKSFDSFEVQKAAILRQMRSLGAGIDGLRWLADVIDVARELPQQLPTLPTGSFYKLYHAIRGYRRLQAGESVQVFAWDEPGNDWFSAKTLQDIVRNELERDQVNGPVEAELSAALMRGVDDDRVLYAASILDELMPENILDYRFDSVWLIWSTPNGWHLFQDSDANLSGLKKPPLSAIIVFATRVLRDLWSISVGGER